MGVIAQMLSVMILVIIHVLMIIVKKFSEFCMTRRFGVVQLGVKKKEKFAWSRLLDEAKRHAKRQHKIWMQSGKSRIGVEFDNMNVVRREYKKELKKAKNLEKHSRCKYVESVLQKKDNML